MKIKLITPDKPIFQVWADTSLGEDSLIIQADNKEHAEKIARQYWANDDQKVALIFQNTQIDLITEDKDEI